jgi:hypothetical protein
VPPVSSKMLINVSSYILFTQLQFKMENEPKHFLSYLLNVVTVPREGLALAKGLNHKLEDMSAVS